MANLAQEALDVMYSAKKGMQTMLESNKSINKVGTEVGKFIFGDTSAQGIRGVMHGLAEGGEKGFKDIMKDAYTVTKDGTKGLNYKAIAGTYVGASVAGRVATGGGLYKDRNGNTNLVGVPFI